MRKFSQSQLGIISESDNIFRIRVVVSDLNSDNSEFFSEVNSEYSDNSEFFSEVIRSIRTIPNFFPSSFGVFGQFRTDFRIICGNNMEIHQNPLFFHENIFFLIRKSPNTPNSIFRANIRNLLLRELTDNTKNFYLGRTTSIVFDISGSNRVLLFKWYTVCDCFFII